MGLRKKLKKVSKCLGIMFAVNLFSTSVLAAPIEYKENNVKSSKSIKEDYILSYSVKENFISKNNEYVDITKDISKVANLKEMTVIVKFRTNSNSGAKTLFSISDSKDHSSELALTLTGGSLNAHIRENNNFLCNIKSTEQYGDNSWHVGIMTLGNSGVKLYVDGEEVANLDEAVNVDMVTELNAMNIGKNLDNASSGEWYFDGDIDYLDIYDRIISGDEVKELSNQEVTIGYDIPYVDLSKDTERQVLVDKEENVYLGHPSTVLMDDKETMYVVYPKGHGVGPVVLKKSEDAGLTWSERLETPISWNDSEETPVIYKIKKPDGTTRIQMISGVPRSPEGGFRTAYSDDKGATWSEFEHHFPTGDYAGIVAHASLTQLKDENGEMDNKWMGIFHDFGYNNWKTYLSFDENGKEVWTEPVRLLEEHNSIEKSAQLCEIEVLRSPDGEQLALIARSQAKRNNSMIAFSNDEGETWTEPVELQGALMGERHKATYDPISGRLLITFREIIRDPNGTGNSNDWVAGDWVAWVGTYDDLVHNREGEYRIRLMEDFTPSVKSGDCGYAGNEVLDDGTYVLTSYGYWEEGYNKPYIKSLRLTLDEIDKIVASRVAPKVTGVSALTKDGTYGAGDHIDFEVQFDKAVFVKGNPQIALNIGEDKEGFADYLRGSGSDKLVFRYVVSLGDESLDLDNLANIRLNGGKIFDAEGTGCDITLSEGLLANSSNIVLDPSKLQSVYEFSKAFSTIQGINGWYYKEFSNGEYRDMTYHADLDGGIWKGTHEWSRIYRPSSMHPGTDQNAVIAFKAPRDGEIIVNGNVKKLLSGGNGVDIKVIHNNTKVWPESSEWQRLNATDTSGYNLDLMLTVTEGDYIYFEVNGVGGNIGQDNTYWNPVITYVDSEIERVLDGFVGSKDKHYFKEDYENIVTESRNKDLNIVSWKGEKLNSQLVLYTELAEIEDVRLEISDFTDENGNVISSSNGEMNFVEYVRADNKLIPDILDINETELIERRSVQPLWFTLNIPKETVPGNYAGTIKAISTGGEEVEFNVNLEVLDMTLTSPEEWTFHLDMWQNPYSVARYFDVPLWSEEHINYLKPHLTRLKDAGQKVITTTIVKDPWNGQTHDPYGSMVEWTKKTDGTFEFDFDDFDKYVELCMEIGIDDQINCYSMVPWANRVSYFDEIQGKEVFEILTPGSSTWNSYWGQFIDAFVAHLDLKGWEDITYIAMDERPAYVMNPVFELLKDTPLKISGAMNYGSVNQISDKVMDMSVAVREVHDEEEFAKFSQERRSKGQNTTLYLATGDYPNFFTYSNPAESAWVGWYSAKTDIDGFLRWSFDNWVENPLETTDHTRFESGDCFIVYPERSSIRFERFREGIQDNEKMRQLLYKHPEWKLEVDKILDNLDRGHSLGDGVDFGYEVSEAKSALEDIVRKILNGEEPTKPNTSIASSVKEVVQIEEEFDYVFIVNEVLGLNKVELVVNYDSELLNLIGEPKGLNGFEVISVEELNLGELRLILETKEGEDKLNGDGEVLKMTFTSNKKAESTEILANGIKLETELYGEENFEDISSTIKVVGKNLALNKPATSSSSESGREASKGNDGDETSRWCAADGSVNHWWQVDLEEIYDIDGLNITWEKASSYGFSILVSEDGEEWREAFNNTDNLVSEKVSEISLNESNVRYIKIQMNSLPSSSVWASFFELKVFGDESGIDPSKEELKDLIEDVKETLINSVEGIDVGQYHEGSKVELTIALENAEEVYNNGSSEEINNSIAMLRETLDLFLNRVIDETTGDINEDGKKDIGDLALASKYQGDIDFENSLSVNSDLNLDGEINEYEVKFISKIILK
ncbi:glycoside hydrolase domain-containing protein [Clostridium sp. B9]|uniref:glycoside hydrolase domain-containing protein n=1 Tax=Clostridium sp. B9 TaxID=3423224 RepID=UPI003D2EC096